MAIDETPDDVERWFRAAATKLWPIAEGSLSFRRCPCIRQNCQACARGEGHANYVLYAYKAGKRKSVYIPAELAPRIEVAIANGRLMQDLVREAGVRYVTAVKRQRRMQSRR